MEIAFFLIKARLIPLFFAVAEVRMIPGQLGDPSLYLTLTSLLSAIQPVLDPIQGFSDTIIPTASLEAHAHVEHIKRAAIFEISCLDTISTLSSTLASR